MMQCGCVSVYVSVNNIDHVTITCRGSGDEPVAKHCVEYTHAHKIRKWRLMQRTAAESL